MIQPSTIEITRWLREHGYSLMTEYHGPETGTYVEEWLHSPNKGKIVLQIHRTGPTVILEEKLFSDLKRRKLDTRPEEVD